jgi:hypothetical protein
MKSSPAGIFELIIQGIRQAVCVAKYIGLHHPFQTAMAIWDTRSETRRLRQPDTPVLSLFFGERHGTDLFSLSEG